MSRFFAMAWLVAVMFFGAPSSGFTDDSTIKTIKIYVPDKGDNDFIFALKAKKIIVGEWARDVLKNHKFLVPAKTEINLVVVSVADMGFSNGARLGEIYEKAQKIGLKICPPEVGPLLRLQHLNQPKNEWLVVGSAPISDSEGGQGLFLVGHGGYGLWLLGHDGNMNTFWSSDYRFVFVFSLPPRRPL